MMKPLSDDRQPVNRQLVNRQPVNRKPVNRQPVQQRTSGEQATGELMHRQLGNRQPVNRQPVNRQPAQETTGELTCTCIRFTSHQARLNFKISEVQRSARYASPSSRSAFPIVEFDSRHSKSLTLNVGAPNRRIRLSALKIVEFDGLQFESISL